MFYQRKFKATHGVDRSGKNNIWIPLEKWNEGEIQRTGWGTGSAALGESLDWIWFLGEETPNHHGRVWELQEEEGGRFQVERGYSWSLERGRSEWIGLRGCWVMGKGLNSEARIPRSNRVRPLVRPPLPLWLRKTKIRKGFVPLFHLGPWKSWFCVEERICV
jgi:hypothetical protein